MMSNLKKISMLKKIAGGSFALVILMAGIICMLKVAKAEEHVVGEFIYSNQYNFSELYAERSAPVKEGYVFGGWYTKTADMYVPLDEEGAVVAENAYAKFVPAYVLSIKAQNAVNTTETMTGTTSTRIITSVDSKNYQKVGFEIYLGNGTTQLKDNGNALETKRVYSGIKIGTGETAKTKTATQIFGTASKHVAVWELTEIARVNHSKIIYVRPYWKTMDGTTVYGLGKYVHIEDDYKNYISIPVNLLTGETVAAGMMNLKYNTELTFVGFEAGRLLPEMNYSHSEDDNTIRMLGNAKKTTDVVNADGIYANIRFEKPSDTTNFDITVEQFCNWAEEEITTLKAWDITYEVAESTGE